MNRSVISRYFYLGAPIIQSDEWEGIGRDPQKGAIPAFQKPEKPHSGRG